MKEIDALKKRVAELEAEVARLRAMPQTVYHYHYAAPAYMPQPTWQPSFPQYPQVWCGGVGAGLQGLGLAEAAKPTWEA